MGPEIYGNEPDTEVCTLRINGLSSLAVGCCMTKEGGGDPWEWM